MSVTTPPPNLPAAAVRAAVSTAARLGLSCTEPEVLADGANVIVRLSPSPVVAKVAASTPEVRPNGSAWKRVRQDCQAAKQGLSIDR
jgi:hypothetical protein